jgi:CAAD domains of cyanobacterial aminoacyl-tRNA synthetase
VCHQWDAVENKTSVVIYGVGAIVILWLSSTIVGAVNNVPLVSVAFASVDNRPCSPKTPPCLSTLDGLVDSG